MSFVNIEKPRPGITLITLNRPERMNAMAFDVMIPFREALEAVAVDNDTRVVVVTGAGDAFCAGADLEDPGMVPNIDGLTVTSIARRALGLLDDVILAVRKMNQPVIAAVNGPAIGGGFCLALASELGISFLLPRAIGSSRAFDIMLTGRDVDAEEANRIGLLSNVYAREHLLDRSYALADRIMGFSRVGIEITKRMLWSSMETGSLAAHMDHEGIAQLYVRMTTQNFEESIRARKEKRPPIFRD
jgi:enoyl-CoA hydratase